MQALSGLLGTLPWCSAVGRCGWAEDVFGFGQSGGVQWGGERASNKQMKNQVSDSGSTETTVEGG